MTSEVISIVVDVNRAPDVVSQHANRKGSSNTSSQDENIYEKLKKAAQDGCIERLYELIAKDPNILGHFDNMPFCETPLHTAAENGQTHFAMELMTLKPSLASKLNVSGFSPMHLALQNNHKQMVRGFLAINKSLVSIMGRGRVTPLHYVAQIGDAELLSEFLLACPSSVNDLTIKCETAVHIAVKNNQVMAFKVLLGWIKRVNRKDILDWKDDDGNTAFHLAATINQTEVMELLRQNVKVNARNLAGKTAMDIRQTHESVFIPGSTMTLAGYLSKKLSFIERRNNLLGVSNLSGDVSPNTSNRHDAILVVAILIVTATFQAALSPPGGFWQDNSSTGHVHKAGQMTMPFRTAFLFFFFNGFAFLSSLYVIIILIIGLPMWRLIFGSTATLGMVMLASYTTISPIPKGQLQWSMLGVFIITAYPLIIGFMLFRAYGAFINDKERRHKVDFPATCFSESVPRVKKTLLFVFFYSLIVGYVVNIKTRSWLASSA